MRPIKPGDLMTYAPISHHEMIGVVLAHHDEIRGLSSSVGAALVRGPGVSIYWQTSNSIVYWSYSGLAEEIASGRMKVVSSIETTV